MVVARDGIEAIVGAMAHPRRARIYFCVADAKETGITVNSLAKKLDEPRRSVRYHVDALIEQGLVGVSGQRRRRGVVERSYYALHRPDIDDGDLELASEEQTQRILLAVLRAIIADLTAAARGGNLIAKDGHLTRPDLVIARVAAELDEQGWSEVAEIHGRTIDVIEEAVARSRARLEKSGEQPIPAVSGFFFFPAAEPFSEG